MKIEDRYTYMETEKLHSLLKSRYGFEDDEIKNLFDTDDKMREALREFKQASTRTPKDDEAALGWDKDDDQPLTADQAKAVENKKVMSKKIAEAKKKREAELKKLQEQEAARQKKQAEEEQEEEEQPSNPDKELRESIKEAGNQVTPTEVRKSMKDVRKLMEEE